jgi:D-alanyl-D-alanine carboxypeptidase (penicillin-binding protein 5/6)
VSPRRRAIPVVLLLALLALPGWSAPAQAADQVTRTVNTRTVTVKTPRRPAGVSAKTAIVLDAQTGTKLWGRRTRSRRLIASTTKMMTAIVAIERTRPQEMLRATAYRAGLGESLLGLTPGERISAQDLIRGLMLVSGNDAADTLAARTASSRAAFVAAMNRKARALGLMRTHFSNPIGLDSPKNYSTASDLAQLARYALTVPRLSSVVRRGHATLRSGSRVRRIKNLNPLIGRYRWAVGVKTGHTMAAGYLLVGAAQQTDARLISVVTGEPTEAARLRDSAELLRYGRAFYRPLATLRRGRAVAVLPVKYRDSGVKVYPQADFSMAVRDGQRVALQLTAPKEVEGPRSRGSLVGRVVVLRDGRRVTSVPVLLGEAVPAPPPAAVMLHTLGRVLPFLLLALALALVGSIFFRPDEKRTRHTRFVG